MASSGESIPARMTAAEKSLVRRLHFDQGKTRTEVAQLLQRSLSSVNRLFAQKKVPKAIGRPSTLTDASVDRAAKLLEKMVDEADGNYEVTMAMVLRRGRFKVCERTLAKAMRERGYRFRAMRQKLMLTPEDITDRLKFAEKHLHKSAEWWQRDVHIHLDTHVFKVATTPKGRKLLANHTVRGVYHLKNKSLRSGHVKPNQKLKLGLGNRSILKAGGVGGGKVLVWHTVKGAWSGSSAAAFCKNIVGPALKENYGSKRK